jgi:predicted O-methyltransferase YrrM
MNEEKWTAVDDYIVNLLGLHDAPLEAALEDSAAAGLPSISVTANQGKFLQLLARIQGARAILEIGTLGGYSTIWLARALPPGGRLISIEIDPKHMQVATANLARAGLADIVDLRLGRALDILPKLAEEGRGPFDLIFIDADKSSMPEYFSWALKLSRKGSVIIADNVVRKGAILDRSSDDPNVQGARRFYEMLAAEPRVTGTAIQTVGSKGHDGFAMVLVTS